MPDLYDPSDPATLEALGRLEPAQISGYLASHGWHLLEAGHDSEYWTEPDDTHVRGMELQVPPQRSTSSGGRSGGNNGPANSSTRSAWSRTAPCRTSTATSPERQHEPRDA